MKGYCPRCEEIRTDTRDDAWGFVWYFGAAVCQRCQCIVEFESNGQDDEEIDEEEDDEYE